MKKLLSTVVLIFLCLLTERGLALKAYFKHLVASIILVLIIGALILIVFELKTLRQSELDQNINQIKTFQFFQASLTLDAQRQKYILFMRDEILSEWERCYGSSRKPDYDRAYRIAEIDYREYTKYPFLSDPLFLLALQKNESAFDVVAVSKAGAIGLNQITPETGRMLCFILGIEYSKSKLLDMDASTRMAAKYLEILHTTYGDFENVLAAYNGGGRQVYYYKNKSESLAKETREYVPKVMNYWKDYINRFGSYQLEKRIEARGITFQGMFIDSLVSK